MEPRTSCTLPPPSSRLNPRSPCVVLLPYPSLPRTAPHAGGLQQQLPIPDSRAPPPSSSQDPPWKPHRLAKYLVGERLHGAEDLLHAASGPVHFASAVSSTAPTSATAEAAASPRHRASSDRHTSPSSPPSSGSLISLLPDSFPSLFCLQIRPACRLDPVDCIAQICRLPSFAARSSASRRGRTPQPPRVDPPAPRPSARLGCLSSSAEAQASPARSASPAGPSSTLGPM